jgi:hypothetical protein
MLKGYASGHTMLRNQSQLTGHDLSVKFLVVKAISLTKQIPVPYPEFLIS